MRKDRDIESPTEVERPAEILREYGPFPGVPHVGGVSFEGRLVWFAGGERLHAFEPANGKAVRTLDVAGDTGTAFDGKHLYQIADQRILKIDPANCETDERRSDRFCARTLRRSCAAGHVSTNSRQLESQS
jgi:hypothetical protein